MKTLAVLAAALAFGLAGAASAADQPAAKPAPKRTSSCFFSSEWDGWRAPNENTIYLRVNVRDIYRVDLSAGSRLLTWSDSHLINKLWGSNSICSPLDLDLQVSDGLARESLIAKSIVKLTPDEVKQIPKKDLP